MYRTIDTALWSDPAVRKLKSAGKLLFLYLITNSHAHVSGIYFLPLSYVVYDTGLTEDHIRRGIDTLSSVGLIKFDPDRDVIWVCNMLRYQGRGEKMLRAAAAQLKTLHNSPLIKEFLQDYPAVKTFYKDRVSIGHPKKVKSGIQEQDQEQDIILPAEPADKSHLNESQGGAYAPRSSKADLDSLDTAPTPSDCDSDTARTPSGDKDKPGGKKPREPNPLFDAIASVTGSDPKASAPHIGRVCKALREADPPYTPDEVLRLPAVIREQGLDFTITLGSVQKYIGWVRHPPAKSGQAAPLVESLEEKQARIHREREQAKRAAENCLSPEEFAQRRKNLTNNLGVMPDES